LAALCVAVCTACVRSDSVLILGGEIDDLLHPSLDTVEALGSCGMFDSSVGNLPHAMRDEAATMYGDRVVICGGYKLLGPTKDCFQLDLTSDTLEWTEFPSLMQARYQHVLLTVAGELYAIGGGHFLGNDRTIEKFNAETNAWELFGEMSGSRSEFCALPLGDDAIILIGGYDDFMQSEKTEKYDFATKTWTQLSPLPLGRDLHSCVWYKDEIVVAGGWIKNNINNDVDTNRVHKYNPKDDTWSEMPSMTESRTLFGLANLDGNLTAIGGWKLAYTATVEKFNEELQSWELDEAVLSQEKGAFSMVDTGEYFADKECSENF